MQDKIRVTRDSVCAGDSIAAPHETYLDYMPWQTLSSWLNQLKEYLPKQPDILWAISTNNKDIAFITCDENSKPIIDVIHPYASMAELNLQSIRCNHFYRHDFKDKYPNTMSMFEIKDDLLIKAKQISSLF